MLNVLWYGLLIFLTEIILYNSFYYLKWAIALSSLIIVLIGFLIKPQLSISKKLSIIFLASNLAVILHILFYLSTKFLHINRIVTLIIETSDQYDYFYIVLYYSLLLGLGWLLKIILSKVFSFIKFLGRNCNSKK